MSRALDPSTLQEDLPLEPSGLFEFSAAVASLGVESDLLDALLDKGPLCFLDFEATGLEPGTDELIEVGAVLVERGNGDASVFNTLVHTDQELTPFIRRLTGISQTQVETAPHVGEVGPALDRFIGDTTIVAHNAAFERKFLEIAVDKRFRDHPFLDTFDLLGLVYPDSPNMKLDTFCNLKLRRRERHRALDDALDTLRILVNIFAEARDGSGAAANAAGALDRYCPSSPWAARLRKLPVATMAASKAATATESQPAPAAVPFEAEAIAGRLSDEDVAGSVLPGFETRSGQVELMRHVHDCFSGSGGKSVVLCEAGTGIGKTLAYLSVAIPFARKTGEQVIISTSGKVLQTQLLEKDIPQSARLLGYPDLRYTAMKGRANYLCRRRADAFLERNLAPPDSYSVALIGAFESNTRHGEIDRIPTVHFQRSAEFERRAREVTSTEASECSRQDCEQAGGDCVFRDARRRLEGAEIAVVNHDLLLRWPPDYPPLRHLILDEIHELVDKADRAYARSAEGIEIRHRVESVLSEARAGRPQADPRTAELGEAALALVETVGAEARVVVGEEKQFQFGRDELVIPADGPGPTWKELGNAAVELGRVLEELAAHLASTAESDDSLQAKVSEVLCDAAWVLQTALPYPQADRYVFCMRGLSRPGNNSWRLVATPVSPAADFELNVLDEAETVFGTSATVSVGADVAGSVRELELDVRARSRLRVREPVESPFDYERNLEVVFISDKMDANRLVDRTAKAIATVASRLGGRTLGLFTSRDRMVKVANILDESLKTDGISVIAPATGGADPHDLVRTFMDADHSVLLGARSFWQGVDIPGDACQAVVIEKLPFDVPGDPLRERRAGLIEEDGGNGFGDYTLPRMLLRLKQMMGRLIRTPSDRGIIVLVESRSEKRYFKRLLDAVPPRAHHDIVPLRELDTVVESFLARRAKTD